MRKKKPHDILAVNSTFDWYDKMASGQEKILFREAKPYWCERIGCIYDHPRCMGNVFSDVCKQHCGKQEIKTVKVIKGYSDEYLLFELDNITCGKAIEVTWTDPKKDYFKIRVGKLLQNSKLCSTKKSDIHTTT